MTAERQRELPIHRSQVWHRAILLALLCLGLALLATSDALHGALLQLLREIQLLIAARPILGAALFIVFAAVSAMFTFVSIAAVVPAAVFAWGAPFSVALLWIGWIAGGVFAYSIGRHLGRPAVTWFTSGNRAIRKLEALIGPDTPFGLILLFQLALPSELPGYVLGITRYSLPRYLLSLGLAELPYALATVMLGESFLQRRGGLLLIMGAAVAAMGVAAFYLLRRKLAVRQRRE